MSALFNFGKNMNKQRRSRIQKIKQSLIVIKNELNIVLDEEQISFDNMPENLQCSIKGNESEDAIDILEECSEGLEKIINILNEI